MQAQETKESSAFTGALESFSRFRTTGGGEPAGGSGAISVIASGLRVVGDLAGSGGIRIEGQVEGSVTADGSVQVGPEGVVDGRVEAEEVIVAGRVSGSIAAGRVARLRAGCRVEAEVKAPAIELEEGGVVNGRLEMTGSGERRSADSSRNGGARKKEG